MSLMFATHVARLNSRKLARSSGDAIVFDGVDGDEVRPWGDEYRNAGSGNITVLRVIDTQGAIAIGALWLRANSFAEAVSIADTVALPALSSAGKIMQIVDVILRPSGLFAVPDVLLVPQILNRWPSDWYTRLPIDGPEFIGGPLPALQTAGLPASGEPIIKEVMV